MQISEKVSQDWFNDLRKVDPAFLAGKLPSRKKMVEIMTKISPANAKTWQAVPYGVITLAKVANAAKDATEFHEILKSGELPAVKLSKEELEDLKGGFVFLIFGIPAAKVAIGGAVLVGGWLLGEIVNGVRRGLEDDPCQ